MLCDTCRYSDSNGYCGQGRTLTGAHYDECSTYKYGDKAEVPPVLPGWLSLIINRLLGLPYIYGVQYRIKLALGLYGYAYNIYPHNSEPAWYWYQYLLSDLQYRPNPIISFSDYEDAEAYLLRHALLWLYIRRERYIP